jgi:hypothetical protein
MSEEEIVKSDGTESETVESTTKTKSTGPMKVVVIGSENCALANATFAAFHAPRGVEVSRISSLDDIDKAVEIHPSLVVYCDPIDIKKNDTLDDSGIVSSLQKLISLTGSGICIRSTLNIETTERLIMALGKKVFDSKVVYMPLMNDTNNIGDILCTDCSYIGGDQKAVDSLAQILTHLTHISSQKVKTGSIFDIVYAKMALSGYLLVKQTYFDQLYDTILDLKNANPVIVRRIIEDNKALVDRSTLVPSSIKGGLVYDSRLLAGASEMIPLLETCLGEQYVINV